MLLTDVGTNALLQSDASGHSFVLDITALKFGALNTNLGSSATEIPGGIVYTASSPQISYSKLNDRTILIKVTLDSSVGDFTYGSVGLYLSTGELFAYDIFPIVTKTKSNLPGVYGDTQTRYYAVTCQNISSSVNLSFDAIVPSELPTVDNSHDLPDADESLNTLYIVKSIAQLGGNPGLAYTDGIDWHYSSLAQSGKEAFHQSTPFSGSPQATGTNAIAIGDSEVDGNNSIAMNSSIAIGDNVFVANTGKDDTTFGDHHVVIGDRNTGGLTSDRHHNTIIGGSQNTPDADNVTAIGAEGAKLNADYSVAIGKRGKTTTMGELAFSSGMFSREGDAQVSRFIFKAITTDTDLTPLLSHTSDLYVEANSAMFGRGVVMSVQTTPSLVIYVWDVILKVQSLGSVITQSLTLTPRAEYSTPVSTVINVAINNDDHMLEFTINALNSNNTRWVLNLETTRIMW